MGSYDDVDFSIFQTFQRFRFLFCSSETVQVGNIHREIFQSFLETSVMLKSQNRGRNQNRDLFSIGCRFERRTNCHFRFPETHVTANQTIHHGVIFHVFFNIESCFFLIGSIFVNKTRLQFVLQIRIGSKRKSFRGFSLCVQFYQVESNLFYLRFGFLF